MNKRILSLIIDYYGFPYRTREHDPNWHYAKRTGKWYG